MEELLDAVESRSLLISLICKESRELKKKKHILETALDTTLSRYGWSERDINFIFQNDNEKKDDIQESLRKSNLELREARDACQETREEELKTIYNLLSLYIPNYGLKPTIQDKPNSSISSISNDLKKKINHSKIEKLSTKLSPHDPESSILWEKITGNIIERNKPIDCYDLFCSHNTSAVGKKIYGIFKPPAWSTNKKSQVKSTNDGSDESIIDFIKSLPIFHKSEENELNRFAQNCFLKRCNIGQVICDSENVLDYFIIKSGVVDQISNDPDSVDNTEELVVGNSFPVYLKSGNITYSYVAQTEVNLICISKSNLDLMKGLSKIIKSNSAHSNLDIPSDDSSIADYIKTFISFYERIIPFIAKNKTSNKENSEIDSKPTLEYVVGKSKQTRRSILQFSLDGDDGATIQTKNSKEPRRASLHSMTAGSKNYTSSTSASDSIRNLLLTELISLNSPELNFDDTLQHVMRLVKDFFGVDRIGVFLIDKKNNTMILKVSQQNTGIEVPLKGLAGFIAKTGSIVNLPDAYLDPKFDSSMDMRTGYRTKQMLCVPIYDRPGSVGGVLQLINTFDSQPFRDDDEKLGSIVAEQIGKLLPLINSKKLNSELSPIYKFKEILKFKIGHVIFEKVHNHLKCSIQVFHGDIQFGKTKHTALYPTNSIIEETASIMGQLAVNYVKRCDFDCMIDFNDIGLKYSDIPLGAHVILNFYSKNNHPVGWTGFTFFDFDQTFKTGENKFTLFEGECKSPLNANTFNGKASFSESIVNSVTIDFLSFETKYYYELADENIAASMTNPVTDTLEMVKSDMTDDMKKAFETVLLDPFNEIPDIFKTVIYKLRYDLQKYPNYLPKYLMSVDWFDSSSVSEAYRFLYTWQLPSYVEALQLLDSRFSDPKVRAYAVQILGSLTDSELILLLNSLINIIKFEPFFDNALTRFLLRRSICNPEKVGHAFYWLLKSDLLANPSLHRFEIILKYLLTSIGPYKNLLLQQEKFLNDLEDVVTLVNEPSDNSITQRTATMREKLGEIAIPYALSLPINSDIKISRILVNKCQIIERKNSKFAIYIAIKTVNYEEKSYSFIFKPQSSARYQRVIIDLFHQMNKTWVLNELDLCIPSFDSMSWKDFGIYHVPNDSKSLSQIISYSSKFTEPDLDIYDKWISLNNIDTLNSRRIDPLMYDSKNNLRPSRRNAFSGPSSLRISSLELQVGDRIIYKDSNECIYVGSDQNLCVIQFKDGKKQSVDKNDLDTHYSWEEKKKDFIYSPPSSGIDIAKEKFMLSAAAYCVASYVLGLGNISDDSIMLKTSGQLYLWAFGRFLCNSKSKLYAVKKSETLVAFSPGLIKILNGENSPLFNSFLDTTLKAFALIRSKSNLIASMFSLLVGNGMPELIQISDLYCIKENLMINLNEKDALKIFKDILLKSFKVQSLKY